MEYELENRVRELVAGGEAGRAELNELLRQHEEARPIAARVLVEESVLVSELRLDTVRRWADVLGPREIETGEMEKEATDRRPRVLMAAMAGLAAAACVTVGLMIQKNYDNGGTKAVDLPKEEETWIGWMRRAGAEVVGNSGDLVADRRILELGNERARIDLDNGVVLSVTGPARIEVGLYSTRLWEGQLIVDVPEDLETYVVETDDGRFVDLGTVFSVAVQPERRTEMAVLSGKVRAERLSLEGDVLNKRLVGEAEGAILDGHSISIETVKADDLHHEIPILSDDVSLAVPNGYRAAVEAAGPVLVWDFEEIVEGGVVPNRVGLGPGGRIRGDLKLGGSKDGGRHLLLGANERSGWIDGDAFLRKEDAEPFTVELWARPDRIHWGHMFHLRVETETDPVFQSAPLGPVAYFCMEFTHARKFHPMPNRPAVRAVFRSPATEHASETLPGGVNSMLASPGRYVPGRWYHLVARVGDRDFTLFVNGRAVTRETITRPDYGNQELMIRLGRLFDAQNDSRQFVGAIDELAIYERALDNAEILAHYRAMVDAAD